MGNGGGGSFQVQPGDLFAASGRLAPEKQMVTQVAATMQGRGGAATGAMATAGPAFSDLVSAWTNSLVQLSARLGTYAANTEAAGVAYQVADANTARTFPSVPKQGPSNPLAFLDPPKNTSA